MPIDGLFLKKLSFELNFLINGKINKIQEVSDTDFIFQIRSNYKNHNLLISTSSEYSRIHLTNKTYEFPYQPKSFTMLLRKHFEGSIITNIYTYSLDRVFVIETTNHNEIGDLEHKKIIIEIMGRYSNMIILKNNIIIDALKKQNTIDSKRTLFPNADFQFLETNKINAYHLTIDEIKDIFITNNIIYSREITNTFMGICPMLSDYIINSIDPPLTFYNILKNDVLSSSFINKNKLDFYINPLDKKIEKKYETLSELLDNHFYGLALKERIRQKTNDISLFVIRQLDKLNAKLVKLKSDYEDASNSLNYKLYGELLIANSYIKGKFKEIEVLNYYTNENIIIPLDIRYNIIDNSKLYFKKYQKSKNALSHISNQIDITNDDILYFNIIKSQIENSNISDILEIQKELQSYKYITNSNKTKTKKTKTKLLSYITNNNTSILVGKNNIQNEIITHKLANSNEYWFHVAQGPGSHVVVRKKDALTENDIRIAASLAALYSPWKDSSSVMVNYTLVRYIKKIPGKRNCFVTYSNEKTIYIDPDINLLNTLDVKIIEY